MRALTGSSAFGNSLGYVTPSGDKIASESLPFHGTLETSEAEIAVFSDKACDHGCAYWRPDAVSHCAPFHLPGLLDADAVV